jgi:hypothetical protein
MQLQEEGKMPVMETRCGDLCWESRIKPPPVTGKQSGRTEQAYGAGLFFEKQATLPIKPVIQDPDSQFLVSVANTKTRKRVLLRWPGHSKPQNSALREGNNYNEHGLQKTRSRPSIQPEKQTEPGCGKGLDASGTAASEKTGKV